jgi:hypothetical protein
MAQLGPHFAAAKLPGLRTGRVVGNLVELGGNLGARRRRTWTRGFSYHQPADPLQ